MKIPPVALAGAFICCCCGAAGKEAGIRPGSLRPDQLREYDSLEPRRKKLIDAALALSAGERWLTYRYGSGDPASGGLDCSGATFWIMEQAGIDPPRSSSAQYEWVKSTGGLVIVPATVTSVDDPLLEKMQPGDLMFWSGTTVSSSGGNISHVQMFLGHEKSDGLAVMVGASDGRAYRGKRRNGYGVFDFRMPAAGSKAKFIGFGSPWFPGAGKVAQPPAAEKSAASGKSSSPVKKQAAAKKKSASPEKKKPVRKKQSSGSRSRSRR